MRIKSTKPLGKESSPFGLKTTAGSGNMLRTTIFLLGICVMLTIGLLSSAQGQDPGAAQPGTTDEAFTSSAASADPDVEIMESEVDWWAEIRKGGTTMVALGFLIVGALGFTLERLWSVRAINFAPPRLFRKIEPLWNEGKFNEVAQICEKDGSVLAQMVLFTTKNFRAPYEILMHSAGDIGAREMKRQYGRTFPIAVIAMLAPLLGLLGTVLGMIGAFRTVAIAGDMGDASLLADDIGKALITTAAGLIIAIPTLAIYHYFRQRISFFGAEVEEMLDELTQPWMQSEEDVVAWKRSITPVPNAPRVAQGPTATGAGIDTFAGADK